MRKTPSCIPTTKHVWLTPPVEGHRRPDPNDPLPREAKYRSGPIPESPCPTLPIMLLITLSLGFADAVSNRLLFGIRKGSRRMAHQHREMNRFVWRPIDRLHLGPDRYDWTGWNCPVDESTVVLRPDIQDNVLPLSGIRLILQSAGPDPVLFNRA